MGPSTQFNPFQPNEPAQKPDSSNVPPQPPAPQTFSPQSPIGAPEPGNPQPPAPQQFTPQMPAAAPGPENPQSPVPAAAPQQESPQTAISHTFAPQSPVGTPAPVYPQTPALPAQPVQPTQSVQPQNQGPVVIQPQQNFQQAPPSVSSSAPYAPPNGQYPQMSANTASIGALSGAGSGGIGLFKNKMVLIAGGAVVLLLLVFGAYHFLTQKTITAADVTDATNAINTLGHDMDIAQTDLNAMKDAGTAAAMNKSTSDLDAMVADAQKQYALVKASPVLHDGATDKAFKVFDAKWVPFITYMQNMESDYKTLGPVAVSLDSSFQSFTSAPPTTKAQLSTYLQKYKSAIDSASAKLTALHMKDGNNQKQLDALNTFLKTSSGAVATAQKDLAAGKVSMVSIDLITIQKAETTYATAATTISSDQDKQSQQLDPSKSLSGVIFALSNLARAKNS